VGHVNGNLGGAVLLLFVPHVALPFVGVPVALNEIHMSGLVRVRIRGGHPLAAGS
jgi:hypothetical protein